MEENANTATRKKGKAERVPRRPKSQAAATGIAPPAEPQEAEDTSKSSNDVGKASNQDQSQVPNSPEVSSPSHKNTTPVPDASVGTLQVQTGGLPSISGAATCASGIQITTTDLLQGTQHVQQQPQQQHPGAQLAGGSSAPVKIEAVIDMAMHTPLTTALEQLLASQQCLSDLEKAGAVDAGGLSHLLRAASAVPTPATQATTTTGATGELGLTLLAQAAAQEEKTGGESDTLPSISSITHLTSSGFSTLPDNNPAIYQQTAEGNGESISCPTFTPATVGVTWGDAPVELGHYNWFSSMTGNMAAQITAAQVVSQTGDASLSPMPPQMGMDSLHPHMLLFDNLSGAPISHTPQQMDMNAQMQVATNFALAITGRGNPPLAGAEAHGAYRLQHIAPGPDTPITPGVAGGSHTAALQSAAAALNAGDVKNRTPSTSSAAGGGSSSAAGSPYQKPKCAYCDLRFDTRTTRDQHARECSSNPYKCPNCGKACLGTVKLQRHIRSHLRSRTSSEPNEERAHGGPDPKCAYCNCRFPSRVVRDRHSRMCAKNPYRCHLCNKAFLGTAKLTRHMRCHTMEGTQQQQGDKAKATASAAPGGPSGLGSDRSDSSALGSGTGSSECNDVGIDERTDQPQVGDARQQPPQVAMAATTGAPMPAAAATTLPFSHTPQVRSSVAMSAAMTTNLAGLVTAPSTMSLASPQQDIDVASVNGQAALSQAGATPVSGQSQQTATAVNGNASPQVTTPSPVPMMVAMPLLSCW